MYYVNHRTAMAFLKYTVIIYRISPCLTDRYLHHCSYEGCEAKFNRPWRLKEHLKKHACLRTYKCEKQNCDKAYFSASHLARHIATNHERKKISEPYVCTSDGCNAVFSTKWGLQRHVDSRHNYINTLIKFEQESKTPFKCKFEQQESKNPFQCKWCNNIIENAKDLKKHQRGHKKYHCDTCKVVFAYFIDYQGHLKKVHPTMYTCEKCNFCCDDKNNLKRHIKKCYNQNSFCNFDGCNKVFTYQRNLTKHINIHHKDFKFTCPHENCGKEIFHNHNFKRHLLLHEQNLIKRTIKPVAKKHRKTKLATIIANQICETILE